MNVGGPEHRMVQVAESLFVESAFDSAVAIGKLLVYLGVHSKSLSVAVDDGVDTSSDAAESQRISSFFSYFPRRIAVGSLDQGLDGAAKDAVRSSTHLRYTECIAKVTARLGNVPLAKLAPYPVEQLHARMEKEGESAW